MLEKLRAHLKKREGFTLIELLVVIAIIAILVLIVIVAINPAERLREAADRRAGSNVRASGTLMAACVTLSDGDVNACDDEVEVETVASGTIPDGTPDTVVVDGGLNPDEACVTEIGRAGRTWFYRQTIGSVSFTDAAFVC